MIGQPIRLRVAAAVLAVLAIGIGAVAVLGGLRASVTRGLPQLVAGKFLDAGQWRVRPLRAWTGERCPLSRASAAAAPCLSLEVELTNLTRASSTDLHKVLSVVDPKLPADVETQLMLARDRDRLSYLHPNMPERVVFSWKLPAANRPRTAVFVITAKRFKERDNLLGGEGWFDPKPVAQVQLPVTVENAPGARVEGAP